MSSFSNYTENAVLNHIFMNSAFAFPTNLYVALSTTDPTESGTGITEPSGGGYSRVTTSGATWSTASTGTLNNSAEISFPTATGDWAGGANLTAFAIFDASTGGNMIAYADLTTARAVLNGDTAKFAVGALVCTLD